MITMMRVVSRDLLSMVTRSDVKTDQDGDTPDTFIGTALVSRDNI